MYVYNAIRRPKENETIEGPRIIRAVHYPHQDVEQVKNRLRNSCLSFPGTWRLYRSVNRRDEKKAKIELAKTLIDQLTNPQGTTDKNPESLWKTILMQPRNKAERLFLIDIDSQEGVVLDEVLRALPDKRMIKDYIHSPNGIHIVIEPFNTALLRDIHQVEVKKDALLYIETFQT